MNLQLNIQLKERRCEKCQRWFATETCVDWKCGSCMSDVNQEQWETICKLQRSIAALRGALTRKAKRRRA